MEKQQAAGNPLGQKPIGALLLQFAIPSIVAMLVSALYNIVDQFFIGRSIGELGNAATNVAFPLSISCTAIGLLLGMGGAAAFNLSMGRGEKEKAADYMGNAAVLMAICGIVLCAVTQLFLAPLLQFFGSPENVLDYAKTYVGITAWGFPFLIVSLGGGHLIRADGSPQQAMLCTLSGAVLNTFLDPLFIFGFGMGMAGAALATIMGQMLSAVLTVRYFSRSKSVKLEPHHLKIRANVALYVASLGMAPFLNQLAMMLVQIVMNNSLRHYGALSGYGASIPLACAGIITKVGMLFFSCCIGIAQAMQPVVSFNYGARNYGRVREAYFKSLRAALCISCTAFVMFQLFPRQIISLFGSGTENYFRFATRYFRIYMFFTFVNCVQPISSSFFTAVGMPKKGIFLSLTRQTLFLLPLIVIFPLFLGIDGIMYAGPIADFMAVVASVFMMAAQMRKMKQEEAE